MADTAARRERLDKLCEPFMRPFKRLLHAANALSVALPPDVSSRHIRAAKESVIKKMQIHRRAKRKQSFWVLEGHG